MKFGPFDAHLIKVTPSARCRSVLQNFKRGFREVRFFLFAYIITRKIIARSLSKLVYVYFISLRRTYEAFQAVSTRLWHSLFFFSYSKMLWMTTKKWLTTIFRIVWKFLWQQWSKSSWNSGPYRFFWNLHHKFFDEKENFWN